MRYVQLHNPESIPARVFHPADGPSAPDKERVICSDCAYAIKSSCNSCTPQCGHHSVTPYNPLTQPMGIVGKCPIGLWDRGIRSLEVNNA